MVATTPAPTNPLPQLLESCRSEPVVYDGVRPDLCPALEQVILDRMKKDRGRRTGSLNVGGWKSTEDFFAWPDRAVQDLRQAIVEIIGMSPTTAWTMVNRSGSHHPRHQHLNARLVGVYYVTVGDPKTPTVFECPCDVPRYELEVEPHPGRVVFCKGAMWHKVPRYAGELPRITVAFDVRR